MRKRRGPRIAARRWLLRVLGVVSPSGAYPVPPRRAMPRKGRSRYYVDHDAAPFGHAWGDTLYGPPDTFARPVRVVHLSRVCGYPAGRERGADGPC